MDMDKTELKLLESMGEYLATYPHWKDVAANINTLAASAGEKFKGSPPAYSILACCLLAEIKSFDGKAQARCIAEIMINIENNFSLGVQEKAAEIKQSRKNTRH